MSEKEKQILETFGKVIPAMTELEKEKLLSFGEGIGVFAGFAAMMHISILLSCWP